ncbi:MAG: 2-C-methyl-D-erythritol 4-phosphate cytidylyltransferase [Desulfamplus sp.]|nr:2-C-methyl-D-erythritol 4-phosphate cytidylyltransferase [Desulfamplus sp.]
MPCFKNCPVYAVVVAGGKGLRMESQTRKQYLDLAGVPILVHTLRVLNTYPYLCGSVVVVPEDDMAFCSGNLIGKYGLGSKLEIVSGGESRQDSVMNGLRAVYERHSALKNNGLAVYEEYGALKNNGLAVYEEYSALKNKGLAVYEEYSTLNNFPPEDAVNPLVMIHDAVRPFVDHSIISSVLSGAHAHGASIPVMPVVDTLKRGGMEGFVDQECGTLDRHGLVQVQTPQAFDLKVIMDAHIHARRTGFLGTDDASLVEHMGKRVFMVPGSRRNIKITTKEDMELAGFLISS